jgi:tRNA nucleotidyltransferase/poly(A) polymerase
VFVFDDVNQNQTVEECFNEMYQNIQERGEIFLSTPSCYTIRYKDKETKEVKDVVMARKEIGYIPGTRTPIIVPGTLYDDLERRDFTLNALAKDDDGNIIDYFNGMEDLKNRVLRTPLPTELTFNDDPLRILRSIRFSITKGFTIPSQMALVIERYNYDEKMKVVSTERIREELYKCFKHDTLETLRILNEFSGLRNYVFSNGGLWLKPTMEQ